MNPHRRQFMGSVPAAAAVAAVPAEAAEIDGGAPVVKNPRATSGDSRHEPKWDEAFTLTVGNAGGDLNGLIVHINGRHESNPERTLRKREGHEGLKQPCIRFVAFLASFESLWLTAFTDF